MTLPHSYLLSAHLTSADDTASFLPAVCTPTSHPLMTLPRSYLLAAHLTSFGAISRFRAPFLRSFRVVDFKSVLLAAGVQSHNSNKALLLRVVWSSCVVQLTLMFPFVLFFLCQIQKTILLRRQAEKTESISSAGKQRKGVLPFTP